MVKSSQNILEFKIYQHPKAAGFYTNAIIETKWIGLSKVATSFTSEGCHNDLGVLQRLLA
jgi:hypothetical protein